MGVTFLKPGSNSTRPPPRGGHFLYLPRRIVSQGLSSLVGLRQSAYLVCRS